MFRIGFVVYLILLSAISYGQWKWVQGNPVNSDPIKGTKGVSHPDNFPGGRYQAAKWTDLEGNFWLMGGPAGGNDLWRYDTETGEWTWMHGDNVDPASSFGTKTVSSPVNVPRIKSQTSVTWVDEDGNLWLFGGVDNSVIPSGSSNALWKYDPQKKEWVWMHGSENLDQSGIYGTKGTPAPNNTPGARSETSCGWVTSDNLWLFGGRGRDANGNIGELNDLWKYTIATNEWTWVNGSRFINTTVNYGEKGVEAITNDPGARWVHGNWKDVEGNFWFFGGYYQDRYLNDLWKYNPNSNRWTWVGGTNLLDNPGNFGEKCVSSPENIPPGRRENEAVWTDNCGNAWMFGGFRTGQNKLNDLWRYSSKDNEWTWVSGDSIANEPGVYGVQSVVANDNTPGGVYGSSYWKNEDGFWLYGGGTLEGRDVLWNYIPNEATAEFTIQMDADIPGKVNFMDSSYVSCNEIQSYEWDFGVSGVTTDVSSEINPSYIYTQDGVYDVTLVVTTCTGSKSSIVHQVNMESLNSVLFVPNSFTPNNDAINDVFIPKLKGAYKWAGLKIFNRWGELLYETENIGVGWDGKKKGKTIASGVYHYEVEYEDGTGAVIKKNGTVSLIR